ncbi:MAG: DegT/DnrJ/EryC1/StrS family aminotransferase [Candidatus Hodarchaeota archaeon]
MMDEKRIELPREFPGVIFYSEEELAAVQRVVKNQSPFRYYGPKCTFEAENLEKEFSRFILSKPGQPWPDESDVFVTAVNSGTGALEVALDALGVGCGDEVAVQGFMWIATISAIVRNRAIPVLVDSDDTVNMDPENLEYKVTDRTKVVIPVPMLGGCVKIGEIMEVVRSINAERASRNIEPLRVLEDNAQSIGAMATGRPGSIEAGVEGPHRIGLFGDIGIFSLQINKNITAGEGGLIITRDKDLHDRIQAIHNVGFVRDKETNINWYGDKPLTWGQGRRITELQAALARVQLKKLDKILANMWDSHSRLEKHLKENHKVQVRGRASDLVLGDTGFFLIFRIPSMDQMAVEERIETCRNINKELNERGVLSIYLHDYEVHVYYNIPQLMEKKDVNNGCPWNCNNNSFHLEYDYHRGVLPFLDKILVSSIGINIPSQLTLKHEESMKAVIDSVLGNYL